MECLNGLLTLSHTVEYSCMGLMMKEDFCGHDEKSITYFEMNAFLE